MGWARFTTFCSFCIQFFATMVRGITKCAAVKQLSESSTEAESPQQKLVRSTIQHPDYLLNYSFPSKNEEWVATKLGKSSKAVKSNSMVAVDCEMVLCQDNTEALVQVCVVDENMEVASLLHDDVLDDAVFW